MAVSIIVAVSIVVAVVAVVVVAVVAVVAAVVVSILFQQLVHKAVGKNSHFTIIVSCCGGCCR